MKRLLPIVVVLLLAIAGGYYILNKPAGETPEAPVAEAPQPAAQEPAAEPAAEPAQQAAQPPAAEATPAAQEIALAPDMALGDPNAPITVIEYASFTCPHCANFHLTAFKPLRENYIDTGKVRFINREVYFDRFGLWAGMVARCGGEMRYFGIADIFFTTQKDWIGSGDQQEVLNNLRKIGRTAGMGDEQIEACLNDEALAQSMVATYQKYAEEDGINGTPTFIINGEKYSNMNYADFSAILDGILNAQ